MRANEKQEDWVKWRDEELSAAKGHPLLENYLFDDHQAHISGERFLVSGHKLVLTGKRKSDKAPVVIKWSRDAESLSEIRRERQMRETLRDIHFAYYSMRFPDELYFKDSGDLVLLITKYIPQEKVFIQLPITEQFFYALSALESQEGTHVATRHHAAALATMGAVSTENDYIRTFSTWVDEIKNRALGLPNLDALLLRAGKFLEANRYAMGRYCGFLTHTDFVPHNLRIFDRQIVILDHTSLIIGNKYESWARFINFMTAYNPELEDMLLRYVKENRGEDEYLCLRAMRVYKLGFLLHHHTAAHQKSEGDLHLLTSERIAFWSKVLESILNNTPVPSDAVTYYKSRAITLRSKEETERHQEISGWK